MDIIELFIEDENEFSGIDAISVVENPAIEEDFYRSYMNGDMKWSKDIMTEIEKPFFETFMKIGWHASMRYALNQMGYIKGNREPFYKLDSEEKEQIKKALEKITK